MRLLYLRTDFYGATTDGGSFTMQKGIVSGLVEQGAVVEVVTSCPAPDLGSVPVHLIPYNRLLMNLPEVFSIAHNGRVLRRIRPILDRFRPEVIYQRHSSHNIVGALLRRHYGVPYILQFDGSEVWMKTYWSKTYLPTMLRHAEQIALRCADMVTVVSEPMKQMAIEAGAQSDRVVVIPNGVDIQHFSPEVKPVPLRQKQGWNDAVIVGFVGTFDRWHGAEILAEALAIAQRHQPKIRGLFVGDGAMFARVVEILQAHNLIDCVALVGRVSHTQVPGYLAVCDILAVPTLPNPDGSEFFGSPTKLFEYMAMEKAIVATPVGQVAEIIRDGENGVWCEPASALSLAEQLLRLANDPSLRQQLGRNARQDAVMRHSWSMRAQQLLSCWEKCRVSRLKM
ncbi:MAG: glycosyltransferase family 4 protein [Candidatus Kapabacteria bacterium]|nr:glycosyltransferase family 4 protein [Candidatus Kapabacteria bacterium]